MNREQMIRMAREAGFDDHHAAYDTRIERFAALVIKSLNPLLQIEFEKMFMEGASAEREQCAKRLEAVGCDHCAENIRKRGQA